MNKPECSAPLVTVLEPTQRPSQFAGLLMAAVTASATAMLLMLAPDMEWPLRISLIAIILLTLKYWGSVLILIAVQLDLFFREPPRSAVLLGPTDLFTVFLVVGLLMFINRNRQLLRRAARRPFGSMMESITSLFRSDVTFDYSKFIGEISRIPGAMVRGIATLAGCVFVSRLLLSTLPDRRSLNDDLRTWMLDESSVLQCSLLLSGIIAAWIVCNEVSWRQLTPGQARLYMRSVFLTIHHADLRMIVRGRLKRRRKAARERSNLNSPPGVLNQKNYAGNQQ